MKKYLTLFVALVTTLITTASYANCGSCEGQVYVSATAGANFIRHVDSLSIATIDSDGVSFQHSRVKFQPGYMGAAAVGYKYNMFRGELEVGYRFNQIKKISTPEFSVQHPKVYVGVFSAMANVYADLELNSIFTPYVGVGIGYANVRVHAKHHSNDVDLSISKSKNEFAYQGIAGVAMKLCDNTDLYVEYRYFDYTHKNKDAMTQNAAIGVRYSF